MKNPIRHIAGLCWLAGLLASTDAQSQGTIAANNINGSGTLFSTSFGLFFEVTDAPYTATPINVTILGGPNSSSLVPIVTLSGPNALVLVGPGRFSDPSGGIYTIPGVAQEQPATLQVLAWKGSAATFAGADPAQDVFYPFDGTNFVIGRPFTFLNPTGGTTPASLDGMPAMWRILDVPEPPAKALAAVGIGIVVLLSRVRRMKKDTVPAVDR